MFGKKCHKQRIHHGKLADAGGDCYFMHRAFPCLGEKNVICISTNGSVFEGGYKHSIDI